MRTAKCAAGLALAIGLAASVAAGATTGTPLPPKTSTTTQSHLLAPETSVQTVTTDGTCKLRGTDPDPVCTPGEISPAVTQANIATTICKSGYTSTIRPPTSYSSSLKRDLLGSGTFSVSYSGQTYTARGYALNLLPSSVELDHLTPLEIGGSPADPKNLWPEQYERAGAPKGYGSESKDSLENYVNAQICAGKMTLAQGQAVFLGDWAAWRDEHLGKP